MRRLPKRTEKKKCYFCRWLRFSRSLQEFIAIQGSHFQCDFSKTKTKQARRHKHTTSTVFFSAPYSFNSFDKVIYFKWYDNLYLHYQMYFDQQQKKAAAATTTTKNQWNFKRIELIQICWITVAKLQASYSEYFIKKKTTIIYSTTLRRNFFHFYFVLNFILTSSLWQSFIFSLCLFRLLQKQNREIEMRCDARCNEIGENEKCEKCFHRLFWKLKSPNHMPVFELDWVFFCPLAYIGCGARELQFVRARSRRRSVFNKCFWGNVSSSSFSICCRAIDVFV